MRNDKKQNLISLVLLMTSGFALIQATAQSNSGTSVGTVHDNTGAVIAGAKMITRDLGPVSTRTVTDDANGEFTIPNLQIEDFSALLSISCDQANSGVGIPRPNVIASRFLCASMIRPTPPAAPVSNIGASSAGGSTLNAARQGEIARLYF